MNTILLLKLLFAHLFSDFILQTDRICQGKKKKGRVKWSYQILHSLIHAITAYLLVAHWCNWLIPTIIFATHFFMDFLKSTYLKNQVRTFIIDQIFHIGVIFILWLFLLYSKGNPVLSWIYGNWNNIHLWCVVTAYLLLLKPTSIFLNLFIRRWTPEEHDSQSLPNAGKWIGYLERILIFTFILTENMEGIGFLLAAKSIFRFGELNKAKDIKTTEYVLIGTLASFTIAILTGFLFLRFV
ncbi:MAG: DUF3307 domain-containing protein [Oscillibacter sp.]|nr:DUF3307 domain-containing protein [Oscillibacter sp.]